jgi:hypothetical protein
MPKVWIIAVAGGFAVLGILLKVVDLQSSNQMATPSGPAAGATPAGHDATPEEIARLGPTPGETAAPEAHGDASQPVASDGARTSSSGHGTMGSGEPFLPGSSRAARNRPGHGRRERARQNGGSLEVGETGSGGGTELAATGHGGDAHSAPGGSGAAGTAPGTKPGDQPAAPPAPVAFQSADDTRYQLDQPVDVPDIGKIVGRSGTLSFWLQPEWAAGNQDDASLLAVGDGQMQVIKNVNFLRFEFTDDAGVKGGIGAPITDWQAGEWHQVTTTWNGNQFSLYLDGQLVSQTLYPGQPMQFSSDSKLTIGSDFPQNRPVAPGVIGSVDVNGRPMGPGEVAQQYAKATGQPAAPPPARK